MAVGQVSKARVHVGALQVGLGKSAGGKGTVGGTEVPTTIKRINAFTTGTITPGAMLTGTTVNSSQTVTGVKVGDLVLAIPPGNYGVGGVSWNAFVSADDTVKIVLTNGTSGTVTPGAGAWVILWIQLV